ncbi:competence protein ComEA [Rheinheimera sp. SA_1]|uniref:ComEA family DNA-binding protein n=1 Tax=Rheinheimera sp. SA_1 TaxID=1827365 RepID=UPI0008003901|nr:helix-hairpin-helix domain-containing protein [Rheinheimera sp. SA_1]OBP14926.1 competence protein ComEA [Rheinheimera sp. SA_1]
MKSLWRAVALVVPALLLNPVIAETVPVAAKVTPAAAKQPGKQQGAKLSINKASPEQLTAIPGIGQKKAQAILDYIKANGPIKDPKQLTEVKGIGDKLAAKIAEFVSF